MTGSRSTPAEAIAGRDIVCVGFNDWDTDVWTNQHHLMARLAATNRVLFVESLGLRRPTLVPRDVRRMGRRLKRGLAGPRRVELDGAALDVLSPLVLPMHSRALARRANARLLPALVMRACARLNMSNPILWAYVPQAEVLLDHLHPGLVVYHCVDDVGAHPRIDAARFREAEARFVRRADIVFASSTPLAEQLRGLGATVQYMPNVADTELFGQALQPGAIDADIAALLEPRIVFTGAIAATKLDVPLLAELARLRPNWSIVLVGPVGLGDPLTDLSVLQHLPDVHLVGARRYAELPAVLRGAQAALIPYRRNELTASIFPMKVYEYLAAGLPVASPPLLSLHGTAGILFAPDAEQTVAQLERALSEDDEAARAARASLAEGHSWRARLREMAVVINHDGHG